MLSLGHSTDRNVPISWVEPPSPTGRGMFGRADDRVIGATRMSSELKPYKKTVYPDYESLVLDWHAERVLRITISRGKVNAMNYQLHHDISTILRPVHRTPDLNAVKVNQART